MLGASGELHNDKEICMCMLKEAAVACEGMIYVTRALMPLMILPKLLMIVGEPVS
jgi:hypothetical protein